MKYQTMKCATILRKPMRQRSITRRQLLKMATSTSLLPVFATLPACSHQKFYNPDQDIIIGGGRFKKNNEINHVLAIANLQQRETQLINTTFLPHGISIDPRNKKHLVAFEQNGNNAAIVDLDQLAVIAFFSPTKSTKFTGHGIFDTTGDKLYCLESDTTSYKGVITVRDSSSLDVIEMIPTNGFNPLTIKPLYKDQQIAICHGGSDKQQAAISLFDIQNRKVSDTIKLSQKEIKHCQIAISQTGQIVVGSTTDNSNEDNNDTPGMISISDTKQNFKTMVEPKLLTEKLFGLVTSICIDELQGIAAACHPQANLLSFWSIDERKLFKAMSVPDPRSITLSLDKKQYIVSYGVDTRAILIRTNDLTADQKTVMQPTYISGNHSINWSSTLRDIMPKKVYD